MGIAGAIIYVSLVKREKKEERRCTIYETARRRRGTHTHTAKPFCEMCQLIY